MRDLNDAVAAAMKQLIADGSIKTIAEKQVAETVKSIVKDALGLYSPFGKQLTEQIRAAMEINCAELGLSGYNQVVLAIVKRQLDGVIADVGQKRMTEDLQKLLSETAPKEMKLSALIVEFKKWAIKQRNDESCTIIVDALHSDSSIESLRGYRNIHLDPKPRTGKYSCQFQIDVKPDGSIYGCRIGGHDPKQAIFMGALYGFEKSLFRLYAAGTKLLIDQEDFDTRTEIEDED